MQRRILAVAAALACSAGILQSAVLLEVDVSDPAAVTFTATANFSEVDDDSTRGWDGVDILAFLTHAVADQPLNVTGSLRPTIAGAAYDGGYSDNYSTGGSYLDINLYAGSIDSQEFSTSRSAFTGTAVVALGSLAAHLPGPGATGNIISGWAGSAGGQVILGQWQVVPEPAAMATMMLGATFLLRRRQRQ